MKEKDKSRDENTRTPEKTNGSRHNLMPEESSWAEDAKEELEDFIESQGIHIRQ